MSKDCHLLGKFNLEGIPPAPRGTPQIEVTFDIDANGIVNVGAKDKATNKEQNIVIQSSGGLSEADIQKMMAEAEANADKDKAKKELVDAKNEGDHQVYSTEKSLSEHSDKLDDSTKDAIKSKIAEVKKSLEGEDAEVIKSKIVEMQKAAQKIYEAISQKKSEPAAEADKDENVMDADFKEKDDKQNKA